MMTLRESYLNHCTVEELQILLKDIDKRNDAGYYIVKGGKIYFEIHQNGDIHNGGNGGD